MVGISRMMCRHRRQAHRRKQIKNTLCFLGIVICIVLLYRVAESRPKTIETDTYFVNPKDTVWSIARKNVSSNMDIRDYIELMYDLNEGMTPDIRCGQAIILPIVEK